MGEDAEVGTDTVFGISDIVVVSTIRGAGPVAIAKTGSGLSLENQILKSDTGSTITIDSPSSIVTTRVVVTSSAIDTDPIAWVSSGIVALYIPTTSADTDTMGETPTSLLTSVMTGMGS